jgi:lysozyme
MEIGHKGIQLIKGFEGFKSKAYLDGGGVPTIGYGTTRGVKLGQVVDQATAEAFLHRDVTGAVKVVNQYVKVALTQDQFDALVCFVYNIGSGNFSKSTLLKLLNAGRYDQVPTQLVRWNRDNGKIVAGLTRRRIAEGTLFTTGQITL